MTEQEKWELINSSETIKQLQDNILRISDDKGNIMGRKKEWCAKDQADYVEEIVKRDNYPARILTRSYGIRAQALYLKYYKSE